MKNLVCRAVILADAVLDSRDDAKGATLMGVRSRFAATQDGVSFAVYMVLAGTGEQRFWGSVVSHGAPQPATADPLFEISHDFGERSQAYFIGEVVNMKIPPGDYDFVVVNETDGSQLGAIAFITESDDVNDHP